MKSQTTFSSGKSITLESHESIILANKCNVNSVSDVFIFADVTCGRRVNS